MVVSACCPRGYARFNFGSDWPVCQTARKSSNATAAVGVRAETARSPARNHQAVYATRRYLLMSRLRRKNGECNAWKSWFSQNAASILTFLTALLGVVKEVMAHCRK